MGALPEQTPVYPVHTLCPPRPEEGARVCGNGITNDYPAMWVLEMESGPLG